VVTNDVVNKTKNVKGYHLKDQKIKKISESCPSFYEPVDLDAKDILKKYE
jgi:hypothetical protein